MNHGGSGMDMDMDMNMSMGTFHWKITDALWFDAWVPKSEPAYIGACIGLFLFAILSRALIAAEIYFIAWRGIRFDRLHNPLATTTSCSEPSMARPMYPQPLTLPIVPPFNWTFDTIRSFLTALVSFVSNLLMLIIMTGNGGYFIVIIAGIFVGEMAFGRFRSLGGAREDHNH
ncbi:Ctr copper transporter [Radiomyces spectabilis]|uniref:Ctr copper transporter n=1 Tax=Radiomyces spectabilis TaxID=64574 RepID=UPI00221EEE4B|nr:Ctr copper transporter [Radiomyces spectabilis]KAI8370349.1 Ctr copper transporter [Radiomyces spectabilis]